MQKHLDYHYKNSCLTASGEYERIIFEYDNPYGHNLGSDLKRKIDYESMVNCPRNSVNREIVSKKR